MKKLFMVLMWVILFLLVCVGAFFLIKKDLRTPEGTSQPVACTMEAKICPDGSSVGRTGPNCEFTACPTIPTPTSNDVNSHSDLIRVSTPLSNAIVTSPLAVTGDARGNWYFEASFPVHLYDANGKELVSTPAQAQGDWMTTDFVPFKATLTFIKPTTVTGTLVLQKDNASGLPEHEDSISIPVRFKN